MNDAQKLQKIKDIYQTIKLDTNKKLISSHVRYNLEGALYDLENTNADIVACNTIRRACDQLAEIEKVLEI